MIFQYNISFFISPNFSGGYGRNIKPIRFLIMETITLLRC
nr:MAG TPA: hypothetical protein [Caudoviricetes sp.]